MSIALESSRNRIEGSGFISSGLSCISILESSSTLATEVVEKREEELGSCSSSIGRNSDLSGRSSTDSEGEDEKEVQSSYKGPLYSLDELEEVLPIRRGISNFYCGKSKSFTSLLDASSSSSIKEFAKPENAYTRKRKNLIASSNLWDKNQNFPVRSNVGGISKRPTITVDGATSSNSENDDNIGSNSNSTSSLTSQLLPPLHPQAKPSLPSQLNFSSWRSFSLADLQCATAPIDTMNCSSVGKKDKHNKLT